MRDWTRERQAVEATGTYGEVDPVGLGRVTVCDAVMRSPAVRLGWIRARQQKRVFQKKEWKNDPSKTKAQRFFSEAFLIPRGPVTRALTSVRRLED